MEAFCSAPSEKAAFGAKRPPRISRCPRETAAFSGFCEPETISSEKSKTA
jgi:hypothetical protein